CFWCFWPGGCLAWVVGSYVWVVWADLGVVDDGVDVIGGASDVEIGASNIGAAGVEAVDDASSGSAGGGVFGGAGLLSSERSVFFDRVGELVAEQFGEELGRWVGDVEVVFGSVVEGLGFDELEIDGRDLAVVRPVLGSGFGVIGTELGLALSVVSQLCGGSGGPVGVERLLSRLEVGVFDLVLSPLVGLVAEQLELGSCELEGHVSGLSALGDSGSGPVLGFCFKVRVGGVEGQLVFGLPGGLLSGFVSGVDRRVAGEGAAVSDSGPCVEIVRAVRPVLVELVAGFELLRVPAGDLVGLQVGDVVRTGLSVGRPLVGRVGEQRLFQVRPGASGQRLVAEITAHIEDGRGGSLLGGK
ncbi:MAG: FliM/FliN family flagellar motor switch protein, partial [Acidimicrobiales bacterium]